VHRLRIRLPLTLAVAALAMTFAGSAAASRAPTSKERAGIDSAVYASSVYGVNRIPRSHYQLTHQRVSTVSDSWATADLIERSGFHLSKGDATVVAVRLAGTEHWVVVDVRYDYRGYVGCGIAPDSVLADLFHDKRYCLGGGTS
jgi:hypothetical protein